MVTITIDLTDEEVKVLNKRGKKNYLQLKEQVEDIVRRSCINFKKTSSQTKASCDDALVDIFSRQTRGRQRKERNS